MPRKKVNWELEWFKIHNPPEQFYFEFGKTVLFSNNLFQTPTVTTNSVLSTKVVEKIFDWERGHCTGHDSVSPHNCQHIYPMCVD